MRSTIFSFSLLIAAFSIHTAFAAGSLTSIGQENASPQLEDDHQILAFNYQVDENQADNCKQVHTETQVLIYADGRVQSKSSGHTSHCDDKRDLVWSKSKKPIGTVMKQIPLEKLSRVFEEIQKIETECHRHTARDVTSVAAQAVLKIGLAPDERGVLSSSELSVTEDQSVGAPDRWESITKVIEAAEI